MASHHVNEVRWTRALSASGMKPNCMLAARSHARAAAAPWACRLLIRRAGRGGAGTRGRVVGRGPQARPGPFRPCGRRGWSPPPGRLVVGGGPLRAAGGRPRRAGCRGAGRAAASPEAVPAATLLSAAGPPRWSPPPSDLGHGLDRAPGRCGRRPGCRPSRRPRVPHSRSPGSRSPSPTRRNDLREGPSRSGRSSAVKTASSSRARRRRLSSARLAKPMPGSSTMRSRATPAASASAMPPSSSIPTSRTTSPYRARAYMDSERPRLCISTNAARRAATTAAICAIPGEAADVVDDHRPRVEGRGGHLRLVGVDGDGNARLPGEARPRRGGRAGARPRPRRGWLRGASTRHRRRGDWRRRRSGPARRRRRAPRRG